MHCVTPTSAVVAFVLGRVGARKTCQIVVLEAKPGTRSISEEYMMQYQALSCVAWRLSFLRSAVDSTAEAESAKQELADLQGVLEDMYEKVEELQQVLKDHLSTKNALKVTPSVCL